MIQLTMPGDYITQTEVLLEQKQIGSDGSFEFTAEVQQPGQYFLKIGYNIHLLYLEPGQSYVLEIPDAAGEELYYPANTDSTRLFYLVGSINYDFNYFNINNYDKFIAGTVKTDASRFILETGKKYSWVTDPFVIAYKDYKIAGLQFITRLKGNKALFEMYLKDRPVLYRHPEYMYFFNEFYEGLLPQMLNSGKNAVLRQVIRDGTPYDTLLAHVQAHEWIQREDIAELFIIRGLYELYYKTGYDKYKIENLLLEEEKKTRSAEIKIIIGNFKKLINKLKPGSPMIDFEGRKPDGTVVQLSAQATKPVYLVFFSPDDPASIQEIPAINNLYDRYKKDVYFLGVCTQCTYSTLQDFVTKYKLKWDCVLTDASVETEYEILRYPSAFLIEAGGTFKESPALLPSEGAEKQVYLVTRKGRKDDNR